MFRLTKIPAGSQLIQLLKNQIKKAKLPGQVAHRAMSPASYRSRTIPTGTDPRLGAVTISLYQKNETLHFPLIQRPIYKGTHSGQISLPGGKVELQDVNLEDTACRETLEEIGLALDSNHIISELSSIYIPPSNFLVHPFLAFYDQKPAFIPEEREVAAILEIPLFHLLDDQYLSERVVYRLGEKEIKSRVFVFQDQVVWGATAMMLNELKHIILRLEG